jgi:hypothetical protein
MRACSSRTCAVATYPGAPTSRAPGCTALPNQVPVSSMRRGARVTSRPVEVRTRANPGER